jgi:hypothetical protein
LGGGAGDDTVRVCDAATDEAKAEPEGHTGGPGVVAFSRRVARRRPAAVKTTPSGSAKNGGYDLL